MFLGKTFRQKVLERKGRQFDSLRAHLNASYDAVLRRHVEPEPTPEPERPHDGERTESFTFDVPPWAIHYPAIYQPETWRDRCRYGFALAVEWLPEELQGLARERKGLVNFRTNRQIPIECHDPRGLVHKLQELEALNRPRDAVFRDHGCTITAHAIYKHYATGYRWNGWLLSPEKIAFNAW